MTSQHALSPEILAALPPGPPLPLPPSTHRRRRWWQVVLVGAVGVAAVPAATVAGFLGSIMVSGCLMGACHPPSGEQVQGYCLLAVAALLLLAPGLLATALWRSAR